MRKMRNQVRLGRERMEMPNLIQTQKPSTLVLIARLIAYVLAFAVPITALALLLPKYAAYILIAGIFLFLAVSAFQVGWEWDDPGGTDEARSSIKSLAITMLIIIPLSSFAWDLIRHGWRQHDALVALACVVYTGLAILPLFFLGRYLHRWKERRAVS